jgi:hypothetical protein
MTRVYRITDITRGATMALHVKRLTHDGTRYVDVDQHGENGNVRVLDTRRAIEVLRFWRALQAVAPNDYQLTRD